MPREMRRWLVIPSITFHAGLIVALLFLGAWHLDRLDPGKHRIDIGYVSPPPAAAEGGPAAKPKAFKHKEQKKIVHEVVVPPEIPLTKPDPQTALPDATGTGDGTGSGTGSGTGLGTGSGDPDSPCTADCGPPEKEAPPKLPEKKFVPPTVLMGLRIAGDTQIQPPDTVKTEMHRAGQDRATGMFQVCLDASGNVASSRQMKSTGFAGYDEALVRGIAAWRYKPYSIEGRGIPVCGVVTFIYAMK